MKINQYCSVCKQHLDMEVIPTDDAGDDGVIWLRCPQCQGFLPKFSGESRVTDATPDSGSSAAGTEIAPKKPAPAVGSAEDGGKPEGAVHDEDLAPDEENFPTDHGREGSAPDLHADYAAALAAADLTRARPYRATETYDVGDVIHHLAYGDIGVVVAKEKLPGGRLAVKVFFEETGVVHLIEQSPTDGR